MPNYRKNRLTIYIDYTGKIMGCFSKNLEKNTFFSQNCPMIFPSVCRQ